jgi:two-component system, response regulator PdtaR
MVGKRYDFCIGTTNSGLKKTVTTILIGAGFYSTGDGNNIPVFLRTIRSVQPWLAVVDTVLPPGNIKELASIIESDGLAAALYLNTGEPFPGDHVQLNWPVEAEVLTAVARAVCSEFIHKKYLQKKVETLQRKLNERKQIEKAKGMLARQLLMNEEEAYRFLQKNSMAARITLFEMADRIINDPGYLSSFSRPR